MKNALRRLALSIATGLALCGSTLVAATVSGLPGQSATLSASASGTAPFTYQWYKAGTAITGATSATYSISQLALTDAGDYAVRVSNSAGSALSTVTSLVVTAPVTAPSITTQPVSVTVLTGQAASFSVVSSGTTPSYQWNKNGVAISGANSASYSLSATALSDAGAYSVTVSNSAATLTSTAATLTVNNPVIAPSISTQPASLTVNAGKSASFSVVAAGTPLSYQWKKNGTAISGATSATYSISASSAADVAAYSVSISNTAGSVSSTAANLTVIALPTISAQPISLTINAGKPASFSVSASSTVAFSYQWKKNGVAISGATSASYALSSTSSSDAGAYSVTVTNSTGSVNSSSASLTVNAAPTYNRVSSISVATEIDASNTSAIVGFVTDGTNSRRFLVRGAGPSLTNYGSTNVLAQPKIEVHSNVNGTDALIGSNTQWSDEAKASEAFIESGAFAFDAGSKDTALVIEVPAGTYTIVLTGVNGSTGNALVELYELPLIKRFDRR